jgi:chaperonin cofactor prefoldin
LSNLKTECKIKPLILLPVTINVSKKISYLSQKSIESRKLQYLNSISNWSKYSKCDIAVIENSGYSFPELKDINSKYYSPNVKVLSFKYDDLNNELKDFLDSKIKSKGVHELISLNYFLKNFLKIKEYSHIIKVTGRFFIPNFDEKVVKKINKDHHAIIQSDENRCEIIGSSVEFINYIFPINFSYHHIEFEFKNRIKKLDSKNILKLPKLEIEKTRRGSGGFYTKL